MTARIKYFRDNTGRLLQRKGVDDSVSPEKINMRHGSWIRGAVTRWWGRSVGDFSLRSVERSPHDPFDAALAILNTPYKDVSGPVSTVTAPPQASTSAVISVASTTRRGRSFTQLVEPSALGEPVTLVAAQPVPAHTPGARPTRSRRSAQVTHRLAALILVGVSVSSVGAGAWAYWPTPATSGSGQNIAGIVNPGVQPTVTISGSTAIIRWTASTVDDGTAVAGYTVNRYNSSNVKQIITSNCAGTVTNIGCIEMVVPAGTWTYTVTPTVSSNWVGTESAASTAVTSSGADANNTGYLWVTP